MQRASPLQLEAIAPGSFVKVSAEKVCAEKVCAEKVCAVFEESAMSASVKPAVMARVEYLCFIVVHRIFANLLVYLLKRDS